MSEIVLPYGGCVFEVGLTNGERLLTLDEFLLSLKDHGVAVTHPAVKYTIQEALEDKRVNKIIEMLRSGIQVPDIVLSEVPYAIRDDLTNDQKDEMMDSLRDFRGVELVKRIRAYGLRGAQSK